MTKRNPAKMDYEKRSCKDKNAIVAEDKIMITAGVV